MYFPNLTELECIDLDKSIVWIVLTSLFAMTRMTSVP